MGHVYVSGSDKPSLALREDIRFGGWEIVHGCKFKWRAEHWISEVPVRATDSRAGLDGLAMWAGGDWCVAAELCEATVARVVSGVALVLVMDRMPRLHSEEVLAARVWKKLILREPVCLWMGGYV